MENYREQAEKRGLNLQEKKSLLWLLNLSCTQLL